jgi:pantoate--beta-alanine ligase
MGALHEGHLSLVVLAEQQADIVVVSIFVNPMQFTPGEDLTRYPRDFERDKKLLEAHGCDIIFAPEETTMYSPGFTTRVCVHEMGDRLCGQFRPGHFDGVATVVAKLFNIVEPDVAVFGQKDAQQVSVIRRMIKDLDWDIELSVGPTIREPDGLAMSSRNSYLTPQDRKDAAVLYAALQRARQMFEKGERYSSELVKEMRRMIEEKESARIDYVSVVDPETLLDLKEITDKALLAVAVHFGSARLIDNVLLQLNNQNMIQ